MSGTKQTSKQTTEQKSDNERGYREKQKQITESKQPNTVKECPKYCLVDQFNWVFRETFLRLLDDTENWKTGKLNL